jgi:hypothetical protein
MPCWLCLTSLNMHTCKNKEYTHLTPVDVDVHVYVWRIHILLQKSLKGAPISVSHIVPPSLSRKTGSLMCSVNVYKPAVFLLRGKLGGLDITTTTYCTCTVTRTSKLHVIDTYIRVSHTTYSFTQLVISINMLMTPSHVYTHALDTKLHTRGVTSQLHESGRHG